MDPDADPAIFVIDPQDANKKLIEKKSFSAYYFLKVPTFTSFFLKIKSPIKSQNSRKQDFSFSEKIHRVCLDRKSTYSLASSGFWFFV